MRHPTKSPAAALALLMAFAALSAAPALAEDWTTVETVGKPVEFRVAGPASWRAGGSDRDGTVTRSFFQVDSEPGLRRGLVASAGFMTSEGLWVGNPGDLPETSRAAFALEAAEELTKNRPEVEMRVVSHDVVGLSGLNALRMVVENDFDSPEGRVFELIEYSVVAYERENDGSHVVLNLACAYAGLEADREATLSRFEAERETIRERFAGSLTILDKRARTTAPPTP